MRGARVLWLAAAGWLLAALPAISQETYLLIVAGLGGEPRFSLSFYESGRTIYDAAREAGVPSENITFLAEEVEVDPERVTERSTKENVEGAFARLAKAMQPEDQLWVVLFGHGSASREGPRFNLPGPDVSAQDLLAAIESLPAKRVAVVNAASASGDFVPVLSAANRVVVTATKSSGQRNETLFGGFFAEAFVDQQADLDKNRQVSLLEAFDFARQKVERHYEEEHLLRTEHPLLDDDGDSKGSLEPSLFGEGEETDGRLAARFYLGQRQATPAQASPELTEALRAKAEAETRLEELRAQRSTLGEELYLNELEQLLVEIARLDATIRTLSADADSEPETGSPVEGEGEGDAQ